MDTAAAATSKIVSQTPSSDVSPLVYIKLAFVALFWGGTFVAGHNVAHAVPLLIGATGRFAVATCLLLIAARKIDGGLPRLNRSQLLGTAALGLTGIFIYNICFFGALSRIPAGRAALFIALNPIVTALASALFLRERLQVFKWIGIVIAFVGAAVVITRGNLIGDVHDFTPSVGWGEILMFGAVSSWAAYTIIGRSVLKGLTAIAATTYASLWGLIFLACGAAFELPAFDWSKLTWQIWASIVYLGAFGTVIGFVWYYDGVKAIGPSRTAVFNNLVPVFGITLAALILHCGRRREDRIDRAV